MMAPSSHAKLLSPSAAHRWMTCAGSAVLNAAIPDESNEFSERGSLAHWLAQWALDIEAERVDAYLSIYKGGQHRCEDAPKEMVITQEMCEHVQGYVDYVRRREQVYGLLLVEQRVHFDKLAESGEEEASGTGDAVLISDDAFEIVDFKYGMGRVFAKGNWQLLLYAIAVLQEHGHLADFKIIRMTIYQPRLDHVDSWEITIGELREFIESVKFGVSEVRNATAEFNNLVNLPAEARNAWEGEWLNPAPKACEWCKYKTDCRPLGSYITETVMAGFADIEGPQVDTERLAEMMRIAPLAENWARAVRAKLETTMLIDRMAVPGFKIVGGRRGAKAWSNPAAAEEIMKKKFRAKTEEMYKMEVVSPTQAFKLFGKSTKRWGQLEALITQADGKPSVAPESDPRPALKMPSADDFENLGADTGIDDLFG